MATKSNYRPSDLAYYTTWWLTSKPSISSQMKTSSSQNCSKLYDQYVTIDEVILYILLYIYELYYSRILIKMNSNQIVVFQ